MNWTNFLKPDKRKVIIFIILFAIGAWAALTFGSYTTLTFAVNGAIAIVVWYLIACLVVWAHDRLRKRH